MRTNVPIKSMGALRCLVVLLLSLFTYSEVRAIAVVLPEQRIDLDFGATLVLAAGTFYDMSNIEGGEYPIYRPISVELPLGFKLDSLMINGIPHKYQQDGKTLEPLSIPRWHDAGRVLNVYAKIVPDTISSAKVLASILNTYQEGTAIADGERVIIKKDITEKTPMSSLHIFDIKTDSLVIDASRKEMYLKDMQIIDGNITFTNGKLGVDSTTYITQKGGNVLFDSWIITGRGCEFVKQYNGLLSIRYSSIGCPIILDGSNATAEIESGRIRSQYDKEGAAIEVKTGMLNIKGGDIEGKILMRGGNLNVSGGYFDFWGIEVANQCNISLSGGCFDKAMTASIRFRDGITIPSASSLLKAGYTFGKEYINMFLPLEKEPVVQDPNMSVSGSSLLIQGRGYGNFGMIIPENQDTNESPAYLAAKSADVGPNGKDVKVNKYTFEILTPKGLAWLAVITNNSLNNGVFENGKQYFDVPFESIDDVRTFKIMNDLDMSGYGENWPSIYVFDDILDGQGHRIYNLDITGTSPSFVHQVGYQGKGIMANLILEGDIYMKQSYHKTGYSDHVGGLVRTNNGLITNCAFIGTIFSESIGSIGIGGIVYYNDEKGHIENCYINTCGGSIGGIRPKGKRHELLNPDESEYYSVSMLVDFNRGTVENCYFAGDIYFDNQDTNNSNIDVVINELTSEQGGSIVSCYKNEDVSCQVLNDNVQNHEQSEDYPWSTWAVDPNKQCGKPYLTFNTITPPAEDDYVVIEGNLPYENTHQGKNVIVRSGAIYTIGEADASIASLTVEEKAQIKVRKPLVITDSVQVVRQIDTDKWTTFCVPTGMTIANNLTLSEAPDKEAIWSKVGYSNENDQKWNNHGGNDLARNTAYLLVARDFIQPGLFYSKNAPFTLAAVTDTVAKGNAVNGNWFQFVANPLWENLQIDGRAYILNNEGTSFELRENPIVPPFHCYMVASEAVMNQVSSLRLSDLPTSIEGAEESGFRVWTEGRTLCVESAEPGDIAIYSVNGAPQARYSHSVGTKRVTLPQGVYIVIRDGKAVKVVL